MKRFAPLMLAGVVGLSACGDASNPVMPDIGAPLMSTAASAPVTLHYWDFNDAPATPTTAWAATIPATAGTGVLTHTFANTQNNTGTTLNAETDVAGRDFTVTAASGMQNEGRHFVLSVPTTGYEAIVLTYTTRRSDQGFTAQEVSYSIDGGATWQENFRTVTPITSTSSGAGNIFRVETVDLTGVPGVKDNAQFQIRVTVDHGATSTSGNNRWDNIKVSGVVATSTAPEPPAPALWRIEGFFSPVDMTADSYNVVRGGSTVPLKFRVFDGETEITETSGITLTVTSLGRCDQVNGTNLPEEVAQGGSSTVRYSTDQWIANWQTPKISQHCYVVRAQTDRGGSTEALFRTR